MARNRVGKGLGSGRRHKARDVVGSGFAATLTDLSGQFLRSKQFQHAATKGSEREKAVAEFLAAYLPTTFAITSGEAVDLHDKRSPQLDIMVYDAVRNFPLVRGSSSVLPVEALLLSIEVKSVLTLDAIRTSVEAARKLKSLLPYNRPAVIARKEGEPADGRAKLFHCIFAYTSDLSETGWHKSEYQRLQEVLCDDSYSGHEIDRVYVANRGMIHPADAYAILERPNTGSALMTFTVHMLNFLQKENPRRDPTPLLHYTGKLRKGYRTLPPKGNKALDGVQHPKRRL